MIALSTCERSVIDIFKASRTISSRFPARRRSSLPGLGLVALYRMSRRVHGSVMFPREYSTIF
jgi:hypothetical protein